MFVLPEFKKPYNAFEPYLDAKTMEIHHQLHHGGYVKNLNQACVEEGININTSPRIEDLFEKISTLSPKIRNNAGGHYNHALFWSILDTSMTQPRLSLQEALEKRFGVLDDFKAEFTKAALSIFGSGWAWLVINDNNELEIITTKNQDNPLMNDINKGYPILGIDVWEHAYYLHYQNRRVDYLKAIWAVINWDEVSRRFEEQPEMSHFS